ncbi:hypothetical protein [Spirosoma litoris]
MKTVRFYSPGNEANQGGSSSADSKPAQHQEEQHEPGNTPLDDQEELPGGYIHGHVEEDEE